MKKCGRSLLLDAKVRAYIRNVREGGGTLSTRVVMVAAGILLSCEKCQLQELRRRAQRAKSFLSHMNLCSEEREYCKK